MLGIGFGSLINFSLARYWVFTGSQNRAGQQFLIRGQNSSRRVLVVMKIQAGSLQPWRVSSAAPGDKAQVHGRARFWPIPDPGCSPTSSRARFSPSMQGLATPTASLWNLNSSNGFWRA